MAAIEYRGLNAVTNFDLSHYITYLRPGQDFIIPNTSSPSPTETQNENDDGNINDGGLQAIPCEGMSSSPSASTAVELLFQSNKFKEMLERTSGLGFQRDQAETSEGKQESSGYSDEFDFLFEASDILNVQSDQDMSCLGEMSGNNNMDIFHGIQGDMQIQIPVSLQMCSSELELDTHDCSLGQDCPTMISTYF